MIVLGAIAGAVAAPPGSRLAGAASGALFGGLAFLVYDAAVSVGTGKTPEERDQQALDVSQRMGLLCPCVAAGSRA